MRLTKIQNALQKAKINYDYSEKDGFGSIVFVVDGKRYLVDELSGTRGSKPIGIYTNIENWGQHCTQSSIAKFISSLERTAV